MTTELRIQRVDVSLAASVADEVHRRCVGDVLASSLEGVR
jgi:hypothetical protein